MDELFTLSDASRVLIGDIERLGRVRIGVELVMASSGEGVRMNLPRGSLVELEADEALNIATSQASVESPVEGV